MAKQVGPLFITGTIDGIIFYQLNGVYLMRSKGDYKSGKQMRKDPRLKRTMQNADQFGQASKMVKYTYYRYLPPEVRKQGLYGELTGMVKRWLQAGKSSEEAEALLIAHCKTLQPKPAVTQDTTPTVSNAPKAIPATTTQQPRKKETKAKQARYLSRWKVNKRGHLHIPKAESGLPIVIPLAK